MYEKGEIGGWKKKPRRGGGARAMLSEEPEAVREGMRVEVVRSVESTLLDTPHHLRRNSQISALKSLYIVDIVWGGVDK